MRLLDLFCGAGGAAMGYARAGFEVTGMDIKPQPHYPFGFWHDDAMAFLQEGWAQFFTFDAIHASPPCQAYSRLNRLNRREHPDLVAQVRDLLDATGLPYVIENVIEAPLIDPIILCGSMLELNVRRHRAFETNWPIKPHHWPCRHKLYSPRFRSLDGRATKSQLSGFVGVHGHLNYAGELAVRKEAMGIDWMTNTELVEAIPPAYTEFIGHQLMAHIANSPGH